MALLRFGLTNQTFDNANWMSNEHLRVQCELAVELQISTEHEKRNSAQCSPFVVVVVVIVGVVAKKKSSKEIICVTLFWRMLQTSDSLTSPNTQLFVSKSTHTHKKNFLIYSFACKNGRNILIIIRWMFWLHFPKLKIRPDGFGNSWTLLSLLCNWFSEFKSINFNWHSLIC